MQILSRLRQWVSEMARVPWIDAFSTLRERFREDRLALTASSLTFTTIISLVPFIAVALAVFTAFPMFAKFQDVLQKWLIASLVPDNIARQVLGYLNQFAGKASKLGAAGIAVLFTTALALVFTIDRTLNSIWRVRSPRPFAQRVLIYWTAITLGPLMLAVSLSITSYAVSASKGLVGALPGGVGLLLDAVQFLLVAGGMAALYRFVPNTFVRWGHAWMGGIFVSAAMELAKKALAIYLSKVPTYSMVYGAFATVPILLVWIYLAWSIVLAGAVVVAYLPSLMGGIARRPDSPGWSFQLALEMLAELSKARGTAAKGYSLDALAQRLSVDALQLEQPVEALMALDWIGQLADEDGRLVLLVEPDATLLAPLVQRLLLPSAHSTRALWAASGWNRTTLAQALAS